MQVLSQPSKMTNYLPAGLSYYMSNHQDPNISNQGREDDSEAEDFEVQASDFVILAARNEDEVSHIEVCCFSQILIYHQSSKEAILLF